MCITNKKAIKQLMSIGVQRNDAATFAKVYRKIINAGRRDLFPEMEFPVPKIVRTAPVQTLGVSILRYQHDLEGLGACGVDVGEYVRRNLARELAQYLISSPYVVFRQRALFSGQVEFKAHMSVVASPEEI